ncbi:riboflavin synthase [Granulibacter bethesdensis]|uniref:Riboflavin synthase n=1 Tax=Granulibacter bethesdensis TaxID=364410 RepID=A0AAN0RDD4_9PROT|nr:riboflavin synthase [Granulibacter bethesdensis]AHJ62839.1 Riboflavin synthase alpha chain [Granulibacter bethesdensis]AHJ66597.1 Riboflavin synthase alpha chain [Granulibacter bethesdensis CGDNIH4]APH59340.1 Riboflavin synthase alpha chain [Granulibacter bethesdensis]
MFTGIVTGLGSVAKISPLEGGSDMRLTIITPEGFLTGAVTGASIACSGCCLTVVEFAGDTAFVAEVSAETLSKTTLGSWQQNSVINLERALKVGDELGGHIVSGHVDGVAELISILPEHGSTRMRFRAPSHLACYIAQKGSIAVDGVSLTVNEVENEVFGVNIIPHTCAVTTIGTLVAGSLVNIEIDMLARYVARLSVTRDFEAENELKAAL